MGWIQHPEPPGWHRQSPPGASRLSPRCRPGSGAAAGQPVCTQEVLAGVIHDLGTRARLWGRTQVRGSRGQTLALGTTTPPPPRGCGAALGPMDPNKPPHGPHQWEYVWGQGPVLPWGWGSVHPWGRGWGPTCSPGDGDWVPHSPPGLGTGFCAPLGTGMGSPTPFWGWEGGPGHCWRQG